MRLLHFTEGCLYSGKFLWSDLIQSWFGQLPWFISAEFVGLIEANKGNNSQAIKATTRELDRVLRVAATGSLNTTKGLLLGLLEETRAVYRLIEIRVSRVKGGFIIYICSDSEVAIINFD